VGVRFNDKNTKAEENKMKTSLTEKEVEKNSNLF